VYFIFEDEVMAVGRYILIREADEELTVVCDKLADILDEWPVFPRYVGEERFPQTNVEDERESLRAVAKGARIGPWRIQADGTLLAISRPSNSRFPIAVTVYSREPGLHR
jgi:hypothetical protein